MVTKKLLAAAVLVLATGARSPAGEIAYVAATNRIVVTGYAAERPATLTDLLEADRKHKWGRVSYDEKADNFTVHASLWIGTNTDYGTFFQIGRTDHPRETLTLHGDLVVTPPKNSGRVVKHWTDYDGSRRDHRYRISNRLTLGDPGNPDIRPTVKIACSSRNEFNVRVMAAPPPEKVPEGRWYYTPVGEWHMFHATLTAAVPDSEHTYEASICLSHAGVNYRMKGSTFSWWDGSLFKTVYIPVRGLGREDRTVRGMTFENGGSAAGLFHCVDCVLRNLSVARVDNGGLRCVFESNDYNIQLTHSHVGVVLTDCQLGPQRQSFTVPRSTRPESWLRSYSVYRDVPDLKLVLNPGVIERISLPVVVTDAEGRPVPIAAVTIDCPTDPYGTAVERGLAVTGEDGLTPSRAEGRALVITARELRPTDDPAQPNIVSHRYRMRVSAPGFAPHETELDSAKDIPRPVQVVLDRAR